MVACYGDYRKTLHLLIVQHPVPIGLVVSVIYKISQMGDEFRIFKRLLSLSEHSKIFIIITFCCPLRIRHVDNCKRIVIRRACFS